MKRKLLSLMFTTLLCANAGTVLAGAYGETEETSEAPVAAPAAAAAVEEVQRPSLPIRRWEGFATDAETARGLWVEVGAMYGQETDFGLDDSFVTTELRIAYGGKLWEVGTEIEYDFFQLDNADDVDGFSDLDVWGKLIPFRGEHVSVGGGMIVTFPTGERGFEGMRQPIWHLPGMEDEYGFNPFLTAGFVVGPVNLRTSIGYEAYTNTKEYDKVDYNATFLIPIGDMIVVRAEMQGYRLVDDEFYASEDNDPIAVLPGVDIRLPMGGGELVIRPTGMVGCTKEASDWGVGVSVAFTGIGAM